MNFTKIMTAGVLGVTLIVSMGAIQASAISAGGTVAPSVFGGDLALETLLASVTGNYSNSQESGAFRAAVYRNAGGTLDFTYDVNENATGQLAALASATMSMFGSVITDVMYVDNSSFLAAPNGYVAPATVTRSLDGNVVKFFFSVSDPVSAGKASDTLIIRTDAVAFTEGSYSVQDGQTSNLVGYQPAAAVPEPGSMALLGSALIGLACLSRKLRKA